MLVLSRKPLESIRIGENIRVQLLRIEGGRVRIGIDAPGYRIVREEIEPIWSLPPAEIAKLRNGTACHELVDARS
jgi:carbon storage regulator CsrA